MTVDIVIPTYKPTADFFLLIKKLKEQSMKVNKIIIMNTEEKYFEILTCGTRFLMHNRDLDIFHLSRKEFDHGRTRNMGAARSDADFVVFMTQDAMPDSVNMIHNLVTPLIKDSSIAVSYARQKAKPDSSAVEKITREFNYPPKSYIKSKKDLPRLGIKTYFSSNVCAAYNMEIFRELKGFISHTIFNEDMIYAAKAIKAGYKIAYVAEAHVIHSHDYTVFQQFHRNFDLGISQADHPEIFSGVSSKSEGKKLVRTTIRKLKQQELDNKIFPFILMCGSKYLGFLFGKHYKQLPERLVYKWSMNKMYWRQL